MADILPFRALRYSTEHVSLDKVVTQPYDKISPEMERRYLDGHPNSIVRIIRPHSDPAARDAASPYQYAGSMLDQWRRDGIIRQASEPSLFAYFQRFRLPGSDEIRVRKGFICLTRLEDYASQVVFPHERTLTGPKQDRLELLRHTRTHFGQVFLLYSDPDRRVDGVLDAATSTAPEVSVRDEYDVEHQLWSVRDAAAIGAIRLEMAGKKLVIADGHHRYETALAFRDEKRRESGSANAGSYEWLMTTLVNMDSPGMSILATHRLLSNFDGFDVRRLVSRAGEYFDVEEVGDRAALESRLKETVARGTIGLAAGESGGVWLLRLRGELDPSGLLDGVSPLQAQLDVVILHGLILGRWMGISEDDVRRESYVRYIRGFSEAVDAVRSGGAQAAFLLNATRLDQVRDIAFGGEVLPQKSTDFFPKLLSGLTMYSMD